jgi:large subunit ribosomal protein L19
MESVINKAVKPYLKKNIPAIKPGDVVRIHQIVKEGSKERIQVFEGVVIARHGGDGISATFTVRKISFGIGVERTYPLHSPRIVKVERTKTSTVRRSKLYYLRELTGKAARLRDEKVDRKVWEEKGAEDVIEQIAEAVAEEAEARAEEKAEEAGEVIEETNTAMTDEEKAAKAAGVDDDKSDDETPTEVARHEEENKA